MRKLIALAALLILNFSVSAQIFKPVKWTFTSEAINDQEANLIITAKIDAGWHVYSQFIEEGGPIPTTFQFVKSADYALVGKTSEKPKAVSAYDNNFAMQISWHEKVAVFTQKIRLKKSETTVKGTLEFMVCNDKQCLPPEEIEFSINVKTKRDADVSLNTVSSDLTNKDALISNTISDSSSSSFEENDTLVAKNTIKVSFDSTKTTVQQVEDSTEKRSLWAIFIAGFIGGILALLMPCIFPMLPLTVSFFTKKASTKAEALKKASLYGLFIIVIYVLLGMGITLMFGSDALNEMASNGFFNFIFFVMLVVFAISFFGAFEITLPASWVNKMDSKSDKGGLVGLFFMAFALALVSFSCTGPIIGTLLVQAAIMGEYMGPAIGMFGFSLALAIPFALFAAFPSLLKSLPKSGGWLNSVKVSLGFIELALALKFLSNVDLAYHWGIFDREIFLILWIVIFTMLGFYLLGKLKFAHDSDLPYVSTPRLFLAIITLSFSLYMVPGLWGAPLKAISAWLPPQTTQDFDLYTNTLSSPLVEQSTTPKKYQGLFKAPHNLDAFFDYEEGLAYAAEQKKPVLVDFTGHSCVNCRKMEASVWSEPEVLKRLQKDFVLISLYVDDKTELPVDEQYVSPFSGKKIKTIGNKWSDLQASTFKTNSQPYYVILNQAEKILVTPQAFDLSVKNYVQFLDNGLAAYKEN